MTWSDIPRNPTPRVLRQFAVAWLVFFSAYGLFQYSGKGRHELGMAMLAVGVVAGLGGIIRPGLLRYIFVGWMILAFPIGWLVSQLMLILMFFGIITPMALLFRLTGRDVLRRKRPSGESYWTPKAMPKEVRSYFRQN